MAPLYGDANCTVAGKSAKFWRPRPLLHSAHSKALLNPNRGASVIEVDP